MSSSQDSNDFNSEDYDTPAEDLRERMITRFGHLDQAQLLIFLRRYNPQSHGNMSVNRIVQELANIIEDFQNVMRPDRNPVEQAENVIGRGAIPGDDDDSEGEDDVSIDSNIIEPVLEETIIVHADINLNEVIDNDVSALDMTLVGMSISDDLSPGARSSSEDSVDFNREDYATPCTRTGIILIIVDHLIRVPIHMHNNCFFENRIKDIGIK